MFQTAAWNPPKLNLGDGGGGWPTPDRLLRGEAMHHAARHRLSRKLHAPGTDWCTRQPASDLPRINSRINPRLPSKGPKLLERTTDPLDNSSSGVMIQVIPCTREGLRKDDHDHLDHHR